MNFLKKILFYRLKKEVYFYCLIKNYQLEKEYTI